MVNPTMYIFINRGLGMSPAKMASQAAHAAVEAYRGTDPDSNALRLWLRAKHYKKIILLGRDTEHMQNILTYLVERNIVCVPIIDEGLTEVMPHSLTAIGCAVLDKDIPENQAIFSTFELYKEAPDMNKIKQEFMEPIQGRRRLFGIMNR